MTDIEIQVINDVARRMYNIAADHGFHQNDGHYPSIDRMAVFAANLHGEVSEFWEAVRKGKLSEECDKDCDLTCAEEELADIVIRVMDTAVSLGVDLGKAISYKAFYNIDRPYMHGKQA